MQAEAISFKASDEIITPFREQRLVGKWLWGKWFLTSIVVFLIHLSTIEIAPFLHKDEFLIVDFGRIMLHPNTDWAIAWVLDKEQPAFFLCYLGPVLQELSFQITGELGPRISALIGALIASTMIVNWLLSKGTSRNFAFILGLVFLLDPIFVQSYSLARVDSWMIAFCIASCWMLADVSSKLPNAPFTQWRLLFAGALFAIAFFIWPTAVFFFPLIFLEFTCLITKIRFLNKGWKTTAIPFVSFGIGAIMTGTILLMPIFPLFYTQFFDLAAMQSNIGAGTTKSGWQLVLYSLTQLIDIFRVFKFTPVLFLVFLVSMIRGRQTGLIIALLAAIAFMIFTKVYVNRVVNLLPYLIVSVAGIYQFDGDRMSGKQPTFKILGKYFLAALLLWSIGLSIIVRFFLAEDKMEERKREIVYKAAQSMIGPGNYGVFSTYEFYYPGRSLGWKMYIGYDEITSAQGLKRISHYVDYVILHHYEVTKEIDQVLAKEGLYDMGRYYVYENTIDKDHDKANNIKRLRNLYSIFRQPYGDYRLYAREVSFPP